MAESPSERSRLYRATVIDMTVLTPTVKHYTLRFDGDETFRFKPGQYVQISVPKEGALIQKPYSIASTAGQINTIEFCIKRVEGGYVSNCFDRLVGGESFGMRGPLGRFHLREPVDSDLVFLATGTGIAPFRSMLHGLFPIGETQSRWPPYEFQATRQVWLYFGVRYEHEVLYTQEFSKMAACYSNFHFIPTISRPSRWQGATGYVQDHVTRYEADPASTHVYVCGLLPMIESSRRVLKGMGFQRDHIHYEIYT